ncbi:MAG: DUF2232 domain-containing protein [Thermodesulfobacteriota bacterium]
MVRIVGIWCLCLGTLLLFFIGGRLNPIVSLFTVSLTPLPIYLAGRRLGSPAAFLLVLAAFLSMVYWQPDLETVTKNLGVLELLLLGVLLSTLESWGWTTDRAMIISVAGLTLLSLMLLGGQAYLAGMTLKEIYFQKTGELTEMLTTVLAGAGDQPTGVKIMGVTLEEIKTLIRSMLPALVITNTGLVAWINVLLARKLLVLFQWGEPEPPLCYWSAPEWLIFPVLGVGFLLLVPAPWVRLVSMNLLAMLALLYFFQGMAVIASWFQRFRVPLFVRCLGYPLMFLQPLFLLVITTLGLADIWLDFRKLHQPKDV